jgi:serine protease Do
MSTRTKTLGSLFTLAMASMLLGAVIMAQVGRPEAAHAAEFAPAPAGARAPAVSLDDFRGIARSATAGVVNISTSKVVKGRPGRNPFQQLFGDDFMDRYFGGPQGRSQTQTSLGSGFVIDKQGYILTNRHVVDEADEIKVTLADGKTEYDAKLVGKDARTDVALLKIEPKGALTVLPLGDSDRAEVAEWVMAIGSPFGLGSTVTVGVISYKGRPFELGTQGSQVELLQTDASINPGNSGGPLINTRGEVIGINTLIVTQGAPQSAGIGFAVPINVAREILPQLRDKGRVVRGWLGVQIRDLTADMAKSFDLDSPRGALIEDVTEGSPAADAGLREGDVVVEIDGRPVDDSGDVSSYVASRAPGTTVRLRLMRAGREKNVSIALGTFPEERSSDTRNEDGSSSLGMSLRALTPELARQLELPRDLRGVVVTNIEAGEAAERAGLQPRDVIIEVDGRPVSSVNEFEAAIESARADEQARLRVRRGETRRYLILKLK